MARYLAGRILHSLLVILGVLVLVFVLVRLAGDPTPLYLPSWASPQDLGQLRHQLGLDLPLPLQLARYLASNLRGDFGLSWRQQQPALALVLQRLPATLMLTGSALVVSLALALPLGMLAALRRDTVWDAVSMSASIVGQAMPVFWLGSVLIIILAVYFPLFPTSGSGSLRHLVLPGLTLGLYGASIVARLIRSSLIETLAQDYVRTAQAKGLSQWQVLVKHTFRNAAIPVLTLVGLQFGSLMGGAVVTEQVFAYPGMGRLAIQAIGNRDFALVQAFVVVVAAVIVLVNLAVDLLYLVLDPRITYR